MVFAWAFGNVSKYIIEKVFCQHLKKFFFSLDLAGLVVVKSKYCAMDSGHSLTKGVGMILA